jgi:arabinofuranan 3-O-arabinosyltransferase
MPGHSGFFDSLLDKTDPVQVLQWLRRRANRWVICWLLVLAQASFMLVQGWLAFNSHERRDGNLGHTTIDFGGQWLMGRMIVEGRGRQLYHREALRPVLARAYPEGDQNPKATESDAELLMGWLAGSDDSEAYKVCASFFCPLAASNGYEATVALAAAETTWTDDRIEHVTAHRIGGAL